MNPTRSPRFIQPTDTGTAAKAAADPAAERAAVRAALLATPASVSPKYLYDTLGSRLFDAITELPEYYPTRTESAIFGAHATAMAHCMGPAVTLIDLGAGNCAKAARLFPLLEPRRYVAIDISADYLRDALRQVQRDHPRLEIIGVAMDFSRTLELPAELTSGRPVFFYPGSSIGNFERAEAVALLRRIAAQAHGGGLLIGADLLKSVATMEAAYDDALGLTAAFNLNLLRHLNRLIDSDFEPAQWKHVALFNTARSRIEMHLEARCDVRVQWPGGVRHFKAGERLHTENACKYTSEGFAALLAEAGFRTTRCWTDEQRWFGVFWAEV